MERQRDLPLTSIAALAIASIMVDRLAQSQQAARLENLVSIDGELDIYMSRRIKKCATETDKK